MVMALLLFLVGVAWRLRELGVQVPFPQVVKGQLMASTLDPPRMYFEKASILKEQENVTSSKTPINLNINNIIN